MLLWYRLVQDLKTNIECEVISDISVAYFIEFTAEIGSRPENLT